MVLTLAEIIFYECSYINVRDSPALKKTYQCQREANALKASSALNMLQLRHLNANLNIRPPSLSEISHPSHCRESSLLTRTPRV